MVNEGMKVSVSTLRGKVFWIRQDRLEAATQSLSNALRSTTTAAAQLSIDGKLLPTQGFSRKKSFTH